MDVQRFRRKRCDIQYEEDKVQDGEFAGNIIHKLTQQGFCTVDLDLSSEFESSAMIEVGHLDEAGALKKPPDVLVSGLLGDVGSARIHQYSETELHEGNGFSEVDNRVSIIDAALRPWTFSSLGFDLSTRSPLLLHEASDAEGETHTLTEEEGLQWWNWYAYHRLMIIVFVGPGSGVIELKPLLDEDAESYEVNVEPGMCIILRADALGHSFQAPTTSYTLTSWLCEHSGLGPSQKRAKVGVFHLGHCRDLEDWLVDRFEVLLKKRDEELKTDYVAPLPRRVETYLARFFDRGAAMKTAVRGMALDVPSYMDRNSLYAGMQAGCDSVAQLTNQRWDMTMLWDEDPNANKVYSFHAAFCESIYLFDNKFFDLSPAEAKGMAPEQRKILECSFQSFHEAGWTRKTLMKQLVGVYIGSPMSEYGFNPSCSGMGSDGSTLCGRVNFVFGLMGPTMTLDCEAASGLATVYNGMTSLNAKPKPMNDWAFCAGSYHSTSELYWLFRAKLKWLTRMGRSFSYDEHADGYAQGEATAGFFMDRLWDEVDGKEVMKDSPCICNLINGNIRNDGRGASFIAPSAPQLEELHHVLAERAGIAPLDIDVVECYGIGKLLADSVEASATAKALRNENLFTIVDENVLGITAHLSNQGNALASSASCGLFKCIMAMKWGTILPSLHLRALNPYIELDDKPVILGSELLEIKTDMSFFEQIAHGAGGTNCAVLLQGNAENAKDMAMPRFRLDASPLLFWPGGGGELGEDSVPMRSYAIAGSWNDWTATSNFQWEGEGVYGCTITIGEEGFESFQIWLDGDSSRCLHPANEWPQEGTAVMGPDDDVAPDYSWVIDTRDPAAIQDEGEWFAESYEAAKSSGRPGEKYRVQLRVCGKFRMVDWKKL